MIMAKVVGSVWATRKDERLMGLKLLILQPVSLHGEAFVKKPLVAVDTIGAGIGEMVLCLFGYAASMAAGGEEVPVDAAVAGIVDGYEIEETEAKEC